MDILILIIVAAVVVFFIIRHHQKRTQEIKDRFKDNTGGYAGGGDEPRGHKDFPEEEADNRDKIQK